MSKGESKVRRCPACRREGLQEATYVREFHPRGQTVPVRVELLTSVCPFCAAEATSAAQHSENLKRLKARKALLPSRAAYDGLHDDLRRRGASLL